MSDSPRQVGGEEDLTSSAFEVSECQGTGPKQGPDNPACGDYFRIPFGSGTPGGPLGPDGLTPPGIPVGGWGTVPPGRVVEGGDGICGTETRGWFVGGVGALVVLSVGRGAETGGRTVGGTVEVGPAGAGVCGAVAWNRRCANTIGLRRITSKVPGGATTHANTSMDTKRSEMTTARDRIRTTSGTVEYAQANRHSD